jgi:hypothetical protein
MNKITGIRSIDFKVDAIGHGVVNWNGSTTVKTEGKDGKLTTRNNHNIPKLRGYTSINGAFEDGNPKYKWPEEVSFEDNPLYISQNCIRHHIFREYSVDLQNPEVVKDMAQLLCSITGLLRGYVIAVSGAEYKRTSPLLITDFLEENKKGNFEQFSTSGSKEKKGDKGNATIYSKVTFGDTKYIGYGSINIEQLQFISLDDRFSRKAMNINNDTEGKKLAERLTTMLKELDENLNNHYEKLAELDNKHSGYKYERHSNIQAVYYKNCVRQGTLFNYGEDGIILNDDAIDVMVNVMKYLIENLTIHQAKGYMCVKEVSFDYNDSVLAKDTMRIKSKEDVINPDKGQRKYAEYFKG